jgi:energy-coupling factor transporter transmembrane protein EcfT
MTEADIIQWSKAAFPGPLVRDSQWLFVFAESIHFVGLCLLIGAMLVIDLRLMGFYKKLTGRAVLNFVPFAVLGFGLCALTGWTMFTSNPQAYLDNTAFKVKLFLIVLAGLNAALFTVVEHTKVLALGPGDEAPSMARTLAIVSLGMWFVILLLGRWLPVFTIGTN